MNKPSVSRALLIVVMLLFTLSACADLDTNPDAAVAPEAGVLVETLLDSEEARTALVEELSEQLGDLSTEAPSSSPSLVTENTFIELYQQVNPAVVNIRVTATTTAANGEGESNPQLPETPSLPRLPGFPFPEMPDLQPMPRQGQGSGFIYDEEGHIITNNHVIALADEITVVFADGTETEAMLVGADPDTDLAVIKIDEDDIAEERLVPLSLGDSDELQIGQHVIAIGNPFGLSGSMSTGIVSGLGRVLPANASQFSIPDVIQTDAAINPGNSGGPLLNLDGEVIGVNTAIASPYRAFAGVGYAVPVKIVRDVVPELITHGRVQHPWLGILGRTLDRETAEAMELDPDQRGVLIAEVVDDSPAHESDLRGSDVQTTIDGREVSIGGDVIVGIGDQIVNDFDDLLSFILNEVEVGQTLPLQILRDGQRLDVEVTLTPRPENNE